MQQCILGSPHSSSSELSPQSSTLLQTWSVCRQTWWFLQRNGLVGGHGCFAAVGNTQKRMNTSVWQQWSYRKEPWGGEREKEAHEIFIACLQRKALWPMVSALPHMSASSSELSPQSSLPSQTHVWSLHKVLLQMNSSGRQKKAPAWKNMEHWTS